MMCRGREGRAEDCEKCSGLSKEWLCLVCKNDPVWTSHNLCRECYFTLCNEYSALTVFISDWDVFPKYLDPVTYLPSNIPSRFKLHYATDMEF